MDSCWKIELYMKEQGKARPEELSMINMDHWQLAWIYPKLQVQVVVWSSFMSWCNTAYCVIPQSCSRFIGSQVPSVRKPAPIQKFLNPWTQLGAWCLTETNLSYIMSHWTISCLGASDFLESPQVANRWSNPVSKNFTKCQTIPWIWNDSPSGSNKMTTSHSHDRLLHRKFFV